MSIPIDRDGYRNPWMSATFYGLMRDTIDIPAASGSAHMSRFQTFIFSFFYMAALLVVSGCGYRFSGDEVALGQRWADVTLRVEGPGVEENPVLAQNLKDRVRARLAIPAHSAKPSRATLRLQLDPTSRQRILEDASGRADQFEMTIRVRPLLEEPSGTRSLPVVVGSARFYEPKAGATTDAVRIRAEKEALEQVVDSLGALLSTDP
ncbi:MAG: hypothetical protein HQL76_08600 [Magnetococcales bacterium]|nr:hypothetical protein [Magnetococcales bacterium]